MLKILGVLINLGVVGYLGFQAQSCLPSEQMADFNIVQNPLVLSCVAVVALFITLKN